MARIKPETLSTANGQAVSKEKQHIGAATVETSPIDPKTDINRWRLRDERGRQTWHYLESDKEVEEWPQSIVDRHHLGLPVVRTPIQSICCIYTYLTNFQL